MALFSKKRDKIERPHPHKSTEAEDRPLTVTELEQHAVETHRSVAEIFDTNTLSTTSVPTIHETRLMLVVNETQDSLGREYVSVHGYEFQAMVGGDRRNGYVAVLLEYDGQENSVVKTTSFATKDAGTDWASDEVARRLHARLLADDAQDKEASALRTTRSTRAAEAGRTWITKNDIDRDGSRVTLVQAGEYQGVVKSAPSGGFIATVLRYSADDQVESRSETFRTWQQAVDYAEETAIFGF